MFTDPVCGMHIKPYIATETRQYQDRTYYFCSQLCESLFVREPQKYAQPSSQTLAQTEKPAQTTR
jgi:Cu+-exporting ATPase